MASSENMQLVIEPLAKLEEGDTHFNQPLDFGPSISFQEAPHPAAISTPDSAQGRRGEDEDQEVQRESGGVSNHHHHGEESVATAKQGHKEEMETLHISEDGEEQRERFTSRAWHVTELLAVGCDIDAIEHDDETTLGYETENISEDGEEQRERFPSRAWHVTELLAVGCDIDAIQPDDETEMTANIDNLIIQLLNSPTRDDDE